MSSTAAKSGGWRASECAFTQTFVNARGFGLTGQDGESGLVTRITEGDPGPGSELQAVNVFLRDVQGDGHGEEVARFESEGVSDADGRAGSARPLQGSDMCEKDLDDSRLIVGLVHESLERRETSVTDELQIT